MANPTDPVNINGNWWHYDATTRTHRPAGDRAAGQASDMERPVSRRSAQTRKDSPFDSRVSITIVSHRSRLADADGISAKAAIDGLVMCGILADDSTREVDEVRHRQIKVKNVSDEKTEIILERVK
jgi:hypothetical protein